MKPQILIADYNDATRTLYSRILSDGRYCLTFAEDFKTVGNISAVIVSSPPLFFPCPGRVF